MNRSLVFWIAAFIITALTLVYQRGTGPTYPLKGSVTLGGREMSYELARSHPGETNHLVKIETGSEAIKGVTGWKRHKTGDGWTLIQMAYKEGWLTAELPHQPPAGKLDYYVTLQEGDESIAVPANQPAVIRFRGDVPASILIVHIFAMFAGLLFSTRAGFECFTKEPKLKKLTFWTILFLTVGGLVMGPLMQLYAFGELWTGWPLGIDLTDNKTAFALLFWVAAALFLWRAKNPGRWVLAASVVTLIVYLIPHSVLGSELDYSKENQRQVSPAAR